jgi:hypothetical protein
MCNVEEKKSDVSIFVVCSSGGLGVQIIPSTALNTCAVW